MNPYATQYATGAMEITGAQEITGAMEITGATPYPWQPGFHTGAEGLPPHAPVPPHPVHTHGPTPPHHPHHGHSWHFHPHFGWQQHPIVLPGVLSQPGGALAYGGAPRVVERPLRDMREFPLGFFQSGIGVGVGTIEVISRPQIVFRGERLVIPSVAVAPFFSLIDIKIGNRSQLVNSTALPAQVFTETAIGIRLSLDTATVAQDISLAVQNIDPVTAHTFQAALIGTAAQ
jgi:hypothetical protein